MELAWRRTRWDRLRGPGYEHRDPLCRRLILDSWRGAANNIAAWKGTSWAGSGDGTNYTVNALVLDSSDALYGGGDFLFVGGITVNGVAKWDGGAWSALGHGMNNTVMALSVDSAGTLYAGGSFTTAGGQAANRIARWSAGTWSGLGQGVSYGYGYTLPLLMPVKTL